MNGVNNYVNAAFYINIFILFNIMIFCCVAPPVSYVLKHCVLLLQHTPGRRNHPKYTWLDTTVAHVISQSYLSISSEPWDIGLGQYVYVDTNAGQPR